MHYDAFCRKALPPLGLNWRKYRRRQSRRGVEARMRELGLAGYADYLSYLHEHPEEAGGLAERMRVTVSRFFRERECWDALARIVLPVLAGSAGGRIRVLCVGSCGGEEPYTLAILWRERLAQQYPDLNLEILALDVDEDNIARASAGRYPPGSLKEMAPEARGRWFVPDGPAMILDHEIRAMVRFAVHDLEEGDLPGGVDLVLCRYLAFTYFTGARLARAAARLHKALAPGGALMIGRRENVPPGLWALFTPWPEAGPCLWKSHPAGPESLFCG